MYDINEVARDIFPPEEIAKCGQMQGGGRAAPDAVCNGVLACRCFLLQPPFSNLVLELKNSTDTLRHKI